MKLALSTLIACGSVAGVLATHTTTKPSNASCTSTAYAGFREIPGIANFCETAFRPTVTITAAVVTVFTASPVYAYVQLTSLSIQNMGSTCRV